MTTLTECAATLTALYLERKTLQVQLYHIQAALNLRQLDLTPADGWPGKDEAQRDTARDLALNGDANYQEFGRTLSGIRDTLADVEATISGVKETASAERWRISELLATALLSRTQGERTEDASKSAPEFDKATQSETDIEFMTLMAPDDDSDIPF